MTDRETLENNKLSAEIELLKARTSAANLDAAINELRIKDLQLTVDAKKREDGLADIRKESLELDVSEKRNKPNFVVSSLPISVPVLAVLIGGLFNTNQYLNERARDQDLRDEQRMVELSEQLNDDSLKASTRRAAALQLGKFGNQALSYLVDTLGSEFDDDINVAVIRGLNDAIGDNLERRQAVIRDGTKLIESEFDSELRSDRPSASKLKTYVRALGSISLPLPPTYAERSAARRLLDTLSDDVLNNESLTRDPQAQRSLLEEIARQIDLLK